jgi:hypothetical protein
MFAVGALCYDFSSILAVLGESGIVGLFITSPFEIGLGVVENYLLVACIPGNGFLRGDSSVTLLGGFVLLQNILMVDVVDLYFWCHDNFVGYALFLDQLLICEPKGYW